jgi:deazaflavin-dependent oxidoreductase (nitroreductase family)
LTNHDPGADFAATLGVMADDTVNGIPKVDLENRPLWKRNLNWLLGGQLATTKTGLAMWRRFAAPIEAPIMKATGGRVRLNLAVPIVVLSSTGARSGQRREIPLAYFTDGDDVILIASNYGGERHPAWYHNLLAHPECELHIGSRGGRFLARETTGPDRDRLYALAVERLNRVFDLHQKRSGEFRSIPVMRLTPAEGN